MKLASVLRYAAIGMATVGLGFGLAAAQSAEIDTTGPHSDNEIRFDLENDFDLDNDNDIDVDNDVDQDARSGDAEVEENTEGGDATTGDASNDSRINTSVELSNSNGNWGHWFGQGSDFDASLDTTGPHSDNEIKFNLDNDVDIRNDNDVDVDNDVDQYARSGDAEVEENTEGGDATTGDASNYSSISTSVKINN